MLLQTVIEIVY